MVRHGRRRLSLHCFSGRYNHLALAFNDAAYVIGGFNGSATGDCLVYGGRYAELDTGQSGGAVPASIQHGRTGLGRENVARGWHAGRQQRGQ